MSTESPICNNLRIIRMMGDITEYLSSKKPSTGSIDKDNIPGLQKLYKKVFIDDQLLNQQEKNLLASVYSKILIELIS